MYSASSLVLAVIVSLGSTNLYAQQSDAKKSSPPPMSEPSKAQRTKMAEMHAQAAECLNSDKSFDECRQQMMDNCPMADDGGCPMMGMHKMPHWGKMKSPDEKPKAKVKK
jgi:hypothetical protein